MENMGKKGASFPSDSKLSLREITKSFRQDGSSLAVLHDISLFVRPGEFVSILGPSGCGKSTLFNVVAGLVQRDGGIISIDNREVRSGLGSVAYMQQKDLLFPWRTVLQNVLLGPEISGEFREEVRGEALQLMARVGLRGFEGNYPAELSMGMRQRAALVRTLLFQKDILLLDEPFGALDAMIRMVMQRLLLDLWMDYRKTILLVTHDVEEALLLSDRVYVLTARPATVKGEVKVDIPRPREVTDLSFVDRKRVLLDMLQGEIERVFA
jgi:ABC-type nitrate/sulfonate/bicarbonate transport system ATPase subunit